MEIPTTIKYEMRIYLLEVKEGEDRMPYSFWKYLMMFHIHNSQKRFPFLNDEREEILHEIEEIVCGFKSETYSLLHVHSDLPLIKLIVDNILKYGTQSVLIEYNRVDSHSSVEHDGLIEQANAHL